jgi:uncharacterized Zn-finger protein
MARKHKDVYEEQKKQKKLTKKSKIKKKTEKQKKFCKICQTFQTNLNRHDQRIHQKIRPYACDYCGKDFYSKPRVVQHMEIHQKYREKKFSCLTCNQKFLTEVNLKNHTKKRHLMIGVVFCEICGQGQQSPAMYRIHRLRHGQERNFLCQQCPYTGKTGSDLKDHVLRAHPEPNNIFTCNHCDKEFNTSRKLRRHIRNQHTRKEISCNYENCDRSFLTNNDLQIHIRYQHLGIKNYECKTCGSSFNNSTKLDRHILSVHVQFKFHCEVLNCSSQFARKETLKSHVRSHHANLGEETVGKLLENIRKFQYPNVKDFK